MPKIHWVSNMNIRSFPDPHGQLIEFFCFFDKKSDLYDSKKLSDILLTK